jgi:hypothetical protein
MRREPDDIQAELAALADETLPAERRERVLACVEESPELADGLEAQRRALAGVRYQEAVRAPDQLRRSIQALADGAGAPRRRYRLRPRLVAVGMLSTAAAAAVVVLAVTATSPSSTGGPAPTVLQAARLALGPATLASPPESSGDHDLLARSVEGVPYPNWGGSLGWQAAGARTDRLGGHTVTTVFYANGGYGRIGYAIVAGSALPAPVDATAIDRGGVRFGVLDSSGVAVVTWRQAGHTCILAARGVASRTLLNLASWHRS